MKFIITFLIAYLSNNFLSAQDSYPLHPSVGDTISLEEKLDYSLFPEIDNKEFGEATIHYQDSGFVLIYTKSIDNETGLEIETIADLSQEQIIEAQKNIEKINAYYRLMAKEEKNKKEVEYVKSKKAYPLKLESKMSKQMQKQARMNVRLREDARRQREFEMGLRPREIQIGF